MEKRILIVYENNCFITLHKKNCFLSIFFSFYHNMSVFFIFRGRMHLLLFHGVLFAKEVPKESIILCVGSILT